MPINHKKICLYVLTAFLLGLSHNTIAQKKISKKKSAKKLKKTQKKKLDKLINKFVRYSVCQISRTQNII